VGVSRYEDLRVWQHARLLCQEIYKRLRTTRLGDDRELSRQLNSASLSVVANIAEGFLRRRDREFVQFLRIAQGSNGEVRVLLQVANDRGYLASSDCEQLVERTNAIGRMLRRLEEYLRPIKD
jgi:four helix bundle protein